MPTIDTVAALLAKAERTDNPDEADAYLSKAQQLATLYAIDLAAAAAANGGRSRSTRPVQRTIVMGQPRKHVLPHLVGLFLAIARPNDVKADIAHNSTYVIAYGLPDDIDTVESIWLACAPRMVHECAQWIAGDAWRGDLVARWTRNGLEEVPVSARGAKATFCRAYAQRVGSRLAAARAAAIVESDESAADHGSGKDGAAMVLVAKSKQIDEYYRGASNARGSWRGFRGATSGRSSASGRAGDAAGQRARLGNESPLPGQRPGIQAS